MKKAIFAALLAALVSCAGKTETSQIEAYLDALRPQFAPHKVTEVVRRDSAVNPLPELQRALDFYAAQKADFESRLADIESARARGDALTVQVATLAAYDVAINADPTAPLSWPTNARDSAFVRIPKDCIGIECRYTRSGASEDQSVFYMSPQGGVAFSNTEMVDRLPDVFDALHDVEAVFDKITRR